MPAVAAPAVSQLSATANRYAADCAVACGLSLLLWAGKGDGLTVDGLAAETTLAQADVGLDMIAVVNLLTAHGLSCRINAGTTTDNIRAEIDAGRPVIVALVWQGRRHALVLRGYDTTGFIINDPASTISRATVGEIERGMVALGMGRQCVFVTDPPPKPLTGPAVTTGTVNVRLDGRLIAALPKGTAVEVVANDGTTATLTVTVPAAWLRRA